MDCAVVLVDSSSDERERVGAAGSDRPRGEQAHPRCVRHVMGVGPVVRPLGSGSDVVTDDLAGVEEVVTDADERRQRLTARGEGIQRVVQASNVDDAPRDRG